MKEVKEENVAKKKELIKVTFIEAAKSIIMQEGVANVTVRRIADITGYSYTTIYHYFENLEELLLETKLLMIQDMVNYGREKPLYNENPLQRLKKHAKIPIDFFIENPNIFNFFYAYKMGLKNETAMRSLDIEKSFWVDYMPFVDKGIIRSEDIPTIARTTMYAVYGIITLFLSGNGLSKEEIYNDLDRIIDLLMKEGGLGEDEREKKES